MWYLWDGKVVIDQERKQETRHNEKLDSKGINFGIPGMLEFNLHQVNNIKGSQDEEQFHQGIVNGNVVCKEIQISTAENTRVQGLCLE